MNVYNGFSPREWRAWNGVGRPTPQRCSVCGCGPERPLAYHAEDYRDRDSVYAICARCHHAIHIRFRRPDHWRRTIAALDPAGWFRVGELFARAGNLALLHTFPPRKLPPPRLQTHLVPST